MSLSLANPIEGMLLLISQVVKLESKTTAFYGCGFVYIYGKTVSPIR